MPVQIQGQPNEICVLRVSGILKRSEFGAEGKALARHIDTIEPFLLVILRDFEGWKRGADWNDLDFHISQGAKFPESPSSLSRLGGSPLAFHEPEFFATPVSSFRLTNSPGASWLAEIS